MPETSDHCPPRRFQTTAAGRRTGVPPRSIRASSGEKTKTPKRRSESHRRLDRTASGPARTRLSANRSRRPSPPPARRSVDGTTRSWRPPRVTPSTRSAVCPASARPLGKPCHETSTRISTRCRLRRSAILFSDCLQNDPRRPAGNRATRCVANKPPRSTGAATDFARLETYLKAIDLFDLADDLAGLEVKPLRNLRPVHIRDRAKASFGENIDHHGQGRRIFENRILRIDHRHPGDGVPHDDRHEAIIDHFNDLVKQVRPFQLIRVHPPHQFLACVER